MTTNPIKVAKKWWRLAKANSNARHEAIYEKYKGFTMNPKKYYLNNLRMAEWVRNIPGDIVECGVWRGGMIAGIAEILGPDRNYYLYDSFEGLPPAQEIDGNAAIEWQQNKQGEHYYDNCKAEIDFAQKAMAMAGVPHQCIKGWFQDTVPHHQHNQIALLRLDGDWYDSTMVCLKHLYPKLVTGGLLILDDYYFWEGCSKAVHDYLSSIQSSSCIFKTDETIAYIIKKD